jgi:hypothetical protein
MQNTYSRIRNFAVCKTAEYKTAKFELPNRISNFMMTELYLPQIECQYWHIEFILAVITLHTSRLVALK